MNFRKQLTSAICGSAICGRSARVSSGIRDGSTASTFFRSVRSLRASITLERSQPRGQRAAQVIQLAQSQIAFDSAISASIPICASRLIGENIHGKGHGTTSGAFATLITGK
ncbi:hypothetical protein M1N47_00510 [Dehalococcoidia bacterium]|nr:hypothetical protein [Dehalococcoidia bacterium]